jgi:hypothetical protein
MAKDGNGAELHGAGLGWAAGNARDPATWELLWRRRCTTPGRYLVQSVVESGITGGTPLINVMAR